MIPVIRSGAMMRCMTLFVVAVFAVGSAVAADLPDHGANVYRKAPPPYGRRAHVEEPDLLFTPSDDRIPDVRFPPHTPLLPGLATLPGYYGSNHSYDYQGPYYGGPNLGYWNRLPYACGVYGYC
jgi:hypothetical protein